MNFSLQRATIEDALELHKIQKLSFEKLLEKYQDFDTNPANEPIEKIIEKLNQPYTYFYFIIYNNKKVGGIRVVNKKYDSPKRISPLFILPEFNNLGLAQRTIKEVEKIYGDTNWELSTILQEHKNCYLYEKMGYFFTGETIKINDKLILKNYKK